MGLKRKRGCLDRDVGATKAKKRKIDAQVVPKATIAKPKRKRDCHDKDVDATKIKRRKVDAQVVPKATIAKPKRKKGRHDKTLAATKMQRIAEWQSYNSEAMGSSNKETERREAGAGVATTSPIATPSPIATISPIAAQTGRHDKATYST